MKILLTLLTILYLSVSCSKEQEPTPEPPPPPPQDYTSVVFVHNIENQILFDCSVGYYIGGVYNKISDLESMTAGKHSKEIKLPDKTITEISLFTQYPSSGAFSIQTNTKNIVELSEADIDEMASQETDIIIAGEGYDVVTARYEVRYSGIFKDDIVRLYLDLTNNGGITIEMSKQLLKQQVMIEAGKIFWFFSIGDGMRPFQSFENTNKDFEGYTGWFRVDLDEQTSKYSLDFKLKQSGELIANGCIRNVSIRKILN